MKLEEAIALLMRIEINDRKGYLYSGGLREDVRAALAAHANGLPNPEPKPTY
jgi:hypothetical protein